MAAKKKSSNRLMETERFIQVTKQLLPVEKDVLDRIIKSQNAILLVAERHLSKDQRNEVNNAVEDMSGAILSLLDYMRTFGVSGTQATMETLEKIRQRNRKGNPSVAARRNEVRRLKEQGKKVPAVQELIKKLWPNASNAAIKKDYYTTANGSD